MPGRKTKSYDVAVIGATGAVGTMMLSILEERNFPIRSLYAIASEQSHGRKLSCCGMEVSVEPLSEFDFNKVQISLFSAGAEISAMFAPKAVAAGNIVIDNTTQFRYDDDIPLVIPEVNLHTLTLFQKRHIISNPNCSTIQMLVALKPIYDAVGIARINVATYQSVSGTGKSAIAELLDQTKALVAGKPIEKQVYPFQIAFNVLPHIDSFQENGYTREEMKIIWETHKILEDNTILINPTAVRVPVLYGHSEAVNIETRNKISAQQVRELLQNSPGVVVIDEPYQTRYPTPVHDAAGKDAVFVGRIRDDLSHPRGINLWIVADNIRKGAALNAVQIAEYLIREYL